MENLPDCSPPLRYILLANGFVTAAAVGNLVFEELAEILPPATPAALQFELNSLWMTATQRVQRSLKSVARCGNTMPESPPFHGSLARSQWIAIYFLAWLLQWPTHFQCLFNIDGIAVLPNGMLVVPLLFMRAISAEPSIFGFSF